MHQNSIIIYISLSFLLLSLCNANPPISLTLIHINDFHAKYEPVTASVKSEECAEDPTQPCVGGYARVVHAVRSLKQKYKEFNPIYINAGDNFQGSIWYGFMRWNVTQAMLNLEPADVMTLGNHEFDHGIKNLNLFMQRINWPVICSNIDTSDEPLIDGKLVVSLVRQFNVNQYQIKVGFVGALYDKTHLTTNTGRLIFKHAVDAVREQAQRLRKNGTKIIIVVSHCGISVDLEIAEKVGDLVDVIVGGHSHTLLWPKGNDKYPYKKEIVDEYPKIVHPTIAPHRKVLIVQAYCHSKIVGALKLDFNQEGEVNKWEANPIYLDQNYPQDAETNKMIDIWKNEVEKISKTVIGRTKVLLEGKNCRWTECTLGNFITRIFRLKYVNEYPNDPILAIVQAATFKGNLVPEEITEGDLMRVFPFDSSIDIMDLEGKYIRKSLEKAAILDRKNRYNFFQRSGFRVTYDMNKKEYERVVDVQVFHRDGQLRPLEDDKIYKLVTNSFIAKGGDGFTEIAENKKNHKVGPDARDTIKEFLNNHIVVKSDAQSSKTVVKNCPYCQEKIIK